MANYRESNCYYYNGELKERLQKIKNFINFRFVTFSPLFRYMDRMKGFNRFYINNVEKLFGYLLRKSGNEAIAADLVQESFVKYLERYRKREANPALLFTIGRNLFYDHSRQRKSYSLFRSAQGETAPPAEAQQDIEEHFIDKQKKTELLEAIRKLSEEEQDILNLVVSSNLKYREIADIRGCSEAAVKVTVHRARKKLRILLNELDNE